MPAERPQFEDLYREFLPRIYAFVRVQVGSAAEAEDVTSQVFMKAYRGYPRYEPRAATPAAWLFRIARNAALDHHRAAGRRQRAAEAVAAEPVWVDDPEQVVAERLSQRELLEAVSRLPERQREAVSLRHGSGLSFLEVGELMGCSEDAAKMLYHRALKALRGLLGQEERG